MTPIRAAGGVVWRPGSAGGLEILAVHRPRLDDWSLPKGKLKRGEHSIAAAFREVCEETGIEARLGTRLPTVEYQVIVREQLTDKIVDYWAMTAVTDLGFTPGAEVDERAWLPVEQALDQLTYPRDPFVLRAFLALNPPLRPPVVVVRHAEAGERGSWPGPDIDRPLTDSGEERADWLAPLLACFAPQRVVSASPRRCLQTLEPLSRLLGQPIEVDDTFAEGSDPDNAAKALARLTEATVVCVQGKLIPAALAALRNDAVPHESASSYHTAKGAGWVLTFNDESLVALDELV